MTTGSRLFNLPEPDCDAVAACGDSSAGEATQSALIVHDDPNLRGVLRYVLTERLGMAGVFEVNCLDSAIEQLAKGHGTSLVVISLDLHGVVPCMTVRLLRRHFPGIRLAILSPCRDKIGALLHLAAGVHGQIDISASADELAEALDLVRRGRVAVPSWLPDLGCDRSSLGFEDEETDQKPAPGSKEAHSASGQQAGDGGEPDQQIARSLFRHQ